MPETFADSKSTRELRSLFCERFRCAPDEFERRAYRKCLYLHARMIAPLLSRLTPRSFERDLLFIRYLGNAKDAREVAQEIVALHDHDRFKPQFARYALRLRVSGRKASALALRLFQLNSAGAGG
ncbi:MAG: hypothetical protein ABSA47_05970 [Verrucomicrobiota bacterium]